MPLSPKQIAARKRGIGGSDAAAALGLSPWKTPFQLWYEKSSPDTAPGFSKQSEASEWGTVLEEVVARKFAADNGLVLAPVPDTLFHPVHDFMLADIDAAVKQKDREVVWDGERLTAEAIVEVKTTDKSNADLWGDEDTDQIPMNYLVQAIHYLIVTDVRLVWVPVLIGGNTLRRYRVTRDPELVEMVIEGEREFWRRVTENDPPPATSLADVELRYRADTGGEVEATEEIVKALEIYARETLAIKAANKTRLAAEQQIKAFLGDRSALTVMGTVFATWKKSRDSQRADLDALRKSYPEVWQAIARPQIGPRKFKVKGIENDE